VWKNGDQSIQVASSARSSVRSRTPVNAGVGSAVKSSWSRRARASLYDSNGRFCADTKASRIWTCFAATSAR